MICVLDLETTIKTTYKRIANPFDKENHIVLLGYKLKGQECVVQSDVNLDFLKDVTILIGQNIKFDLMYLWEYPRFQEWLSKGGRVFDTMIAEYVIQAQKPEALNLNYLSAKYGGTQKLDIVTEQIKAGICPSTMDKKILTDYLIGDLNNTEIVANAQSKVLKDNGQLKLVQGMNEALLCLTEMEYNGLYVDKDILDRLKKTTYHKLRAADEACQKFVYKHWTIPVTFNLASNDHISLLLFGGRVSTSEPVEMLSDDGSPLKYKTGKKAGEIKTKLAKVEHTVKGFVKPSMTKEVKKAGFYKVSDGVLSEIAQKKIGCSDFCAYVLERRGLAKEVGTYYDGIGELIQQDGLVHHFLNQTRTYTGRLSSSDPNSQNIPRKGNSLFKQVFTSRFAAGTLLELDFKQLEVVGAAFLSQDEVLKNEIINEMDMHLENAQWLYNKDKKLVTADERTATKQLTFQLLYGAEAYAMSKALGCSQQHAQEFKDGFYKKYKGLARWHKELLSSVMSNAKRLAENPLRTSRFTSVTGRIYLFTEYKKYDGSISFSMPDIKNYPVQGFATADIVPTQIGRLYRKLLPYRDCIKLINTVHDSVLIDCHPDYVVVASNIAKETLEETDWISDKWGFEFDLPLRVDIKMGNSWWDC